MPVSIALELLDFTLYLWPPLKIQSILPFSFFYPLNAKSDLYLNSSYNIMPGTHIKVMRIKKMIVNSRSS